MNNYRFEDLHIGLKEEFEAMITEEMMKAFLSISGDNNPLHVDQEFALKQGYEDKVVYGMLTSSLLSQLVGVYLPGEYCLLQACEIKYLRPVYPNDELLVTGEVAELHESVKRASIKALIRKKDGTKVVKAKIDVGFLNYQEV